MFEQIRGRQPGIIDIDINREYAVLIPLIETEDGCEVLFEVRSSLLLNQPGEICFPGGRCEENEQPESAAIRETCEELLVGEKQIDLIGPMDILVSPFNFIIYPFLGILRDYHFSFSQDEVARVFTVPLGFFIQNQPNVYYHSLVVNQTEKMPLKEITGSDHYAWRKGNYQVDVYNYEEKVIWGLTAKIMRSAVDIMQSLKVFQ